MILWAIVGLLLFTNQPSPESELEIEPPPDTANLQSNRWSDSD